VLPVSGNILEMFLKIYTQNNKKKTKLCSLCRDKRRAYDSSIVQQSEQVARLQDLESKVSALTKDLDESQRQANRAAQQADAAVARARSDAADKSREAAAAAEECAKVQEELDAVRQQLEARLAAGEGAHPSLISN
jgi:seryl-tRNA synthetase